MYVEQISVLQSRESIMRVNEMAYAFGGMEKNDAHAYRRELNVQAEGTRKSDRTAHRPTSVGELARLTGGLSKVVTQ